MTGRWFSTTEEKLPLPPVSPPVDTVRLAQEIEALEGDIRTRFSSMIETLTGRAEVLSEKVKLLRDVTPPTFTPDLRMNAREFIESLVHEHLAANGRQRARAMLDLFAEVGRERDATEPARRKAENEWREREYVKAARTNDMPDD